MRLLLCSHFSSIGTLMKNEFLGKNVVFIPTASKFESYSGYVGSARKLWKKLGASITEIDIAESNLNDVEDIFSRSDIIYFTGGNSFYLIDIIKKMGIDTILKKELNNGKLFVGESAGAVICAKEISYIEKLDPIPQDFSQRNHCGLGLIDFYILPHYLTFPFKKATSQVMEENKHLDICPLTNKQAIFVDGEKIIELNAE